MGHRGCATAELSITKKIDLPQNIYGLRLMNSKDTASPFKLSVNFNVLQHTLSLLQHRMCISQASMCLKQGDGKENKQSFNPSICEYYSTLPRYLYMNKENNNQANTTQNTGLY